MNAHRSVEEFQDVERNAEGLKPVMWPKLNNHARLWRAEQAVFKAFERTFVRTSCPWRSRRLKRNCVVGGIATVSVPALQFVWMVTCDNLVGFVTWNFDYIILPGRFWVAEALIRLYGWSCPLAILPVHQFTVPPTGVAFSSVSRIQGDADRLAKSFLRDYFLLLSLTIPITISFALFAEEIVGGMLGVKLARENYFLGCVAGEPRKLLDCDRGNITQQQLA